jgi:hypothetical protein
MLCNSRKGGENAGKNAGRVRRRYRRYAPAGNSVALLAGPYFSRPFPLPCGLLKQSGSNLAWKGITASEVINLPPKLWVKFSQLLVPDAAPHRQGEAGLGQVPVQVFSCSGYVGCGNGGNWFQRNNKACRGAKFP